MAQPETLNLQFAWTSAMATLTIESGSDGRVWVTLTRFSDDDLARLKRISGHRWNPERKQWSFPDSDATRKALAEIVALPPAPSAPMLAVKPKGATPPLQKKPYKKYIPGRDKPLTTNPPHPLIKQVDDELVLRAMAYGTRKSYGQHLRNYFDWLKNERIEPARATREEIRAYLVQMASSGLVSAGYCRGVRAALVLLYDSILKQGAKIG
ncbi:MAG: phage integrase N-terminal SAM-like domain-containing protein, partial [Anaerolineales bacterium]|nr:phage integrase N-terminal SAM-like domain-containing protein [Anaerolineales bacterium]